MGLYIYKTYETCDRFFIIRKLSSNCSFLVYNTSQQYIWIFSWCNDCIVLAEGSWYRHWQMLLILRALYQLHRSSSMCLVSCLWSPLPSLLLCMQKSSSRHCRRKMSCYWNDLVFFFYIYICIAHAQVDWHILLHGWIRFHFCRTLSLSVGYHHAVGVELKAKRMKT